MRGPWSHGWGRWVGGSQGRQLELDTELQTKLDLSKLDHEKVAALMKLQVLLLDEVSMLDVNAWTAIGTVFSTVDHSKRPDAQPVDAFGVQSQGQEVPQGSTPSVSLLGTTPSVL